MKIIIAIISIVCLVILAGCGPSNDTLYKELLSVRRVDWGRVIDVGVVSMSFNKETRTQVKTDKMFFVVKLYPPIPLDSIVYMVGLRGHQYVTWDDGKTFYEIY